MPKRKSLDSLCIFHEIYGTSYLGVSEVLRACVNEGEISRRRMEEILSDVYPECRRTIIESLLGGISGGNKRNESFHLLKEGRTHIQDEPERPLTCLERRWLRTMLDDPRIRLFSPSAEGLEDVEPLWKPTDIYVFDKASDPDRFDDPEYIERFRCILSALHERLWLKIGWNTRVEHRCCGYFEPQALEYSARDDKFRLQAVRQNGVNTTINLGRMYLCECVSEPHKNSPKEKTGAENCELNQRLSMEIVNRFNLLERMMVELGYFGKESIECIAGDVYRVTLTYRKEDEKELVVRLLGFGPFVTVRHPASLVRVISERLGRQKLPEDEQS